MSVEVAAEELGLGFDEGGGGGVVRDFFACFDAADSDDASFAVGDGRRADTKGREGGRARGSDRSGADDEQVGGGDCRWRRRP